MASLTYVGVRGLAKLGKAPFFMNVFPEFSRVLLTFPYLLKRIRWVSLFMIIYNIQTPPSPPSEAYDVLIAKIITEVSKSRPVKATFFRFLQQRNTQFLFRSELIFFIRN